MKTCTGKTLEVAFLLALALVYAVFAVRRADVSAFQHANFGLDRLPIKGSASFYRCSESGDGWQEGLPVVLCIGNKNEKPDVLNQFVGRLREPVTLIWCDLLSNLSDDTQLDDPVAWDQKRREFAGLFSRYREILRFDERRVYLTGTGFAGAYAWMLAYDQPGRYAGVVAVSAPSYPKPIQERLEAARAVVTVVLLRERQEWLVKHRAEEERTGRLIQSLNPDSKFSIKSMEGRAEIAKYWVENLRYVLRFSTATPREGRWKEHLDYFAWELPARHVDFFTLMAKPKFDGEVRTLESELYQLSDTEVVLRLRRPAADLGVAHPRVGGPPGALVESISKRKTVDECHFEIA